MEGDIKLQKVTKFVLLRICFIRDIIAEEPTLQLCFFLENEKVLLRNLFVLVLIETHRNAFRFQLFFRKHFKRMTSSPKLFANYVYYACNIIDILPHPYYRFIDILSIITYLSICCWDEGRKEFLNTSIHLFCAFFEKNLRWQFEEEGGWKNFNDYLEKKFQLTKYESLIMRNGMCKYEYFKNPNDKEERFIMQCYDSRSLVLENVNRKEVETSKKIMSLVESVAEKVKELCGQTFEKALMEFEHTHSQVEELCQKTVEKVSVVIPSRREQFSLQKPREKALRNILNKELKEKESARLTSSETQVTVDMHNIISQKFDAPKTSSSQLSVPSNKSETVKKLPMHLAKLSEFVESLSQQLGVPNLKNEENLQKSYEKTLKNILIDKKFKEKEPVGLTSSETEVTDDSNNTISQNIDVPQTSSSQLSVQSKKSKTVKQLLDDMSMDIVNSSESIQSLRRQHGLQNTEGDENLQ